MINKSKNTFSTTEDNTPTQNNAALSEQQDPTKISDTLPTMAPTSNIPDINETTSDTVHPPPETTSAETTIAPDYAGNPETAPNAPNESINSTSEEDSTDIYQNTYDPITGHYQHI